MPWTVYSAYALTISLGGFLLLWWLRRAIERAADRRAGQLEKIKRFDAVRTASPLENQAAEARERGIESIETRFNIIRRVLIPTASVVLLLLVALPLLSGIPAALVSLVVAVAAVVVGIAAKPLLENFFAGIVISFSQPIRIGDTVLIDGHFGTIEDITITHTTVKVWDWRRYMVPNHRMIEKEFLNCSIIDRFQWAYVEFWVSPDADIDRVREIAVSAARESRCYADHEPPRFWVMEMGKEGVRCWVAAWANTPSSAWQLTHDIRTGLIQGFRDEGIRTHVHEHHWGSATTSPPPQATAEGFSVTADFAEQST